MRRFLSWLGRSKQVSPSPAQTPIQPARANEGRLESFLSLAESDLQRARSLLNELRLSASDPKAREQWAEMAFSLVRDLASRDLGSARAILRDVRELVLSHRGEATLASRWADKTAALVLQIAHSDLAAARSLLADLKRLADVRWRETLTRVADQVAASDRIAAESLRSELDA
jgi:hypothetical protein